MQLLEPIFFCEHLAHVDPEIEGIERLLAANFVVPLLMEYALFATGLRERFILELIMMMFAVGAMRFAGTWRLR